MARKKGLKLGRPRSYETANELRKAIEKYLNSCCRTVTVQDNRGGEVLNDLGEPIVAVQYVQPLTVPGLCVALGITTRTWENYCSREKHPEFAEVTEMTRTILMAYTNSAMLTDPKNAKAHEFNLRINYGDMLGGGQAESGGSLEDYLDALGEGQGF